MQQIFWQKPNKIIENLLGKAKFRDAIDFWEIKKLFAKMDLLPAE